MDDKDLIYSLEITNGYMRAFAWRGSERMAISAQENTIHVAIACWPWPPYYSEEARKTGLDLTFAKYKRPAFKKRL